MRVSVVIPNWNGKHLLEKHLTKVTSAIPGADVIVTDDASTDGSVAYLRKNFPNVTVVAKRKREGFASNVNTGVARARGEIVVLLNTDVEPEQGCIDPLLSHFKDKTVFAVGCLEKSSESGKVILRGRGIARWIKGYYIHERGEVNKPNTAWVAGGSGAFRKSMWEQLGGMDTLYNPFYWEDIDISYRARKAGWKTLFESKSVIHHYHEEGKIMSEYSLRDINRIAYRNQFIFIWKNVSDLSVLCAHAVWTPIRLLQAILSGNWEMLEGYCMAVLKLPSITLHRSRQNKLFTTGDRDLDLRE